MDRSLTSTTRVLPKPAYTGTGDKSVFTLLRLEVNNVVKDLEARKKGEIVLKAVLFPLAYICAYVAALRWGENALLYYGLYFILGLLLVFIFLNIIHDAVHDTIFKNRLVNRVLVCFFDLMGANSFIWQLRHVRFHHNYPNVDGWDTDIDQSPLFRVFPHGSYSRMHKYQHLYLPFLYPFYLLNWVAVRDFKDFFDRKKTVRKLVHIPFREYIKLFVFKAVFVFYILILPVLVLDISWAQAITGV